MNQTSNTEIAREFFRPGRDLDTQIAKEVFGHPVVKQKRLVFEHTSQGSRPLANYSSSIERAWEVARQMKITVLPIEANSWFAIAGDEKGWPSPADFIQFLQRGDFVNAGAAVGEDAAFTICIAALQAIRKRRNRSLAMISEN